MADAAGIEKTRSLPLYIEVSGRQGFNDALNGLYKRGHIHEGKIYYTQLYTPYTIRWNTKKRRWFFDWRGLCKDDVASACVSQDVASPHLVTKTWLVFDGKSWIKDPLIKVVAVDDPVIPQRQAFPGADYIPVKVDKRTPHPSPSTPRKKRKRKPKPRKKSKTSQLMSSLYEKVFLVDAKTDTKKDSKRDPANSMDVTKEDKEPLKDAPDTTPELSEMSSLCSIGEDSAASDKEMDEWVMSNMKRQAQAAKKTKGRRSLSHRSNLIALNRHRKKSIDLREREDRLKQLEAQLMAERKKLSAQRDALESEVLGFAKSQSEFQTSMLSKFEDIEADKKKIEVEKQEQVDWREKYESLVEQIEEYDDDTSGVLESVGITNADLTRWTSTDLFSGELMNADSLQKAMAMPANPRDSQLFDDHENINTKLLKKIRSMNSQLDLNPFLIGDFDDDSSEIQGGDYDAQLKEWEKNPMSDLFQPNFGATTLDATPKEIISPKEIMPAPDVGGDVSSQNDAQMSFPAVTSEFLSGLTSADSGGVATPSSTKNSMSSIILTDINGGAKSADATLDS